MITDLLTASSQPPYETGTNTVMPILQMKKLIHAENNLYKVTKEKLEEPVLEPRQSSKVCVIWVPVRN